MSDDRLSQRWVATLAAACWGTIGLCACGGGSGSVSISTSAGANTPVASGTGTAGVQCDLKSAGTLAIATLGTERSAATTVMPYQYAWSCGSNGRNLVGNGVPDHPITGGNFATPISVQSLNVSMSLSPAILNTSGTPLGGPNGAPGYSLNGIKFDPGTAGTCTLTACDPAGNGGVWRMEALGGSFRFGTDANNAHVQPNGEYHLHGVPEVLLSRLAPGSAPAMTLVGWATDGFPVYARYGYANSTDSASGLRIMKSSYRVKATLDAGRPSASTYVPGSFTQDWEFAAGSGDLDECNGRNGVTPEFPKGIYHYFITDSYPYIQRCVKGR
ncbi:MAG: YHYH protein [Betaproteobacteria bacterium]|nr:YHYH protein [Betaproteobacteria bacterium]